MKKMNYRITVNITQKTMKLGFRGKLPDEMADQDIRLQAIFTQRQVERRFPMEVKVEETEVGPQIHADAQILLPYVFYNPPRHKVNIIFALWCGKEEIMLEDQPFPVQKELFARAEMTRKRNPFMFAVCTFCLPFLILKNYGREGKNWLRAAKHANETVYRLSGYNYSTRQQKTDYFASEYHKYASKTKVQPNQILFLSEREPEENGNLMLVRKWFEADPDIQVTEFVNTRTVDALKKKELRECARKCATSAVIILEDFYPQIHSIRKRRETQIVQLWHACGTFKTFGLSRMGKQGGAPQTSMNHRNYDFVSVSSEFIRGIYAEAFGISTGKIKAFGVPRTDFLFDWKYKKKTRETLYQKYPILKESRVILFAPTFRGDGNKDAFYPKDAFSVDDFMENMPEDVVLIIKNHPFVKEELPVDARWAERVMQLNGEEHINDLMLVSSLLITDYSSSIFEAALLELPMLFYAFDEQEYIHSRDFYFSYRKFVPGPVETDFEKMTERAGEMISGKIAIEKSQTDYEVFREAFLGALDGKSTERVCQYIRNDLMGI